MKKFDKTEMKKKMKIAFIYSKSEKDVLNIFMIIMKINKKKKLFQDFNY